MKASDYIVAFLAQRGIDVVFGYIGGMITHLVDSLDKSRNVRFIQTYHEQTASMAAEGYALESGKFGVAISTSGPGATNMLTGIADAYFGSIPVLYITGQVNTYEYKYNKKIRQQGFQETDIVSIAKPITKYAVFVDNAENLCYELEKAVHIATSGRKGPVLIDLPMDVSRAHIEPSRMRKYEERMDLPESFDMGEILELIRQAESPMVLVGGGCVECGKEVQAFLNRYQLPVVTSLMGRGIISEDYVHFIGMIGSYGNRCANMAFQKVDLLIALGSRLDTRQTGAKIEDFMPNGNIIHVDIDINELLYNRLPNRLCVNADVKVFLEALSEKEPDFHSGKQWMEWLHHLKERYNQQKEIERFVSNKAPYRFIQYLNQYTKENDVITLDVGQNQMWAAQTLEMKAGQKFITSGGLAPMGFSLPVAIGVAFANPSRRIFCLNGDGGFHMAVQSLLLISQYHLNIKVIVFNNASLGMITQFQHLYFEGRMAGTTDAGGYLVPSIVDLASAYGLPYVKISEKSLDALAPYFSSEDPVVIEYEIDSLTTVSPKLEYNKPIYRPTPDLNLSDDVAGNE